MSNEVSDDFIYPVRLYASSYMDITDYVIQGKANRRQPGAKDGESRTLENTSDPDAPAAHIRVTCKDTEERAAVLKGLRHRLRNPPEAMYWLLAPKDEYFLFTKDMARVFVPDPQGEGIRVGDDNDIYIAVVASGGGAAAS